MSALRSGLRGLFGAVLACGPLHAQIRVELPDEVVFGAEFELVISSAETFDAKRLRPLVVSRHEALADGSGTRVWARCYECGEVVLAAAGGGESGGEVRLRVRSSLPEGARWPLLPAEHAAEQAPVESSKQTAGAAVGEAASAWPPLEWPNDGYDLPGAARDDAGRVRRWLAIAAGLLVVFGTWFRRRRANKHRRANKQPAAIATTAAASFDGRGAIEQLARPTSEADAARYCLELKAIVRRVLAARYDVPADVRTSEELVAAAPLPDAVRGSLPPCLLPCDAVLFGPPESAGLSQVDSLRDAALVIVAEVGA
ncbi:MAG: hypothetical protein AB8H80_21050 [Planctomycetota bacterium]